MMRYIARRVLQVIPVLVVVSILVFLLLRLIPGDPAVVLAGEGAGPEQVEQMRRVLGLDQPIHVQYWRFISRAVQGDLGASMRTNQPVMVEISSRMPATIQLAIASLAIATLIGLTLGTVAAMGRGRWLDQLAVFSSLIGVSMPTFWLGLMLMLVFGVQLRWLPFSGTGTPLHLLLPAVTLSANTLALVTRLTRASVIEVLGQDYVRTARAKGLAEQVVLIRHALRNALIPTVTVVGLQFGHLLGGAVVVETVFAWPGVGRLMIDSIGARDFPVVQGSILILSAVFVFTNLFVDVLYTFLNPRIRYA